MNIITLFSGIGFQEKSFKNLNIPHNIVYWCEKDPLVSKCFELIHSPPPNTNLNDVSKIVLDDLKIPEEGIDILISTFPCQSFSISGKQKGFEDEKNGSMFKHGLRVIEHTKPKVVIYENVKNIKNKKFNSVSLMTSHMNELGYSCYDKVLNSIDFGIPQNRERFFMVCIRDDLDHTFEFPTPRELTTSVRDFVNLNETNRSVSSDMKPYLENIEPYRRSYRSRNGLKKVFDGVGQGCFKSGYTSHRIYSIDGSSPTFTTSNDCHFLELKGKLTSKERFRLMGMTDEDYDLLIQNGVSENTIHHISGNGVVVNVFQELLKSVLDKIDF